jgi:hypothetical protein
MVFDRDDPAWRFAQWQQQFDEWLEGQLGRSPVSHWTPDLAGWTPFVQAALWVLLAIALLGLAWWLLRVWPDLVRQPQGKHWGSASPTAQLSEDTYRQQANDLSGRGDYRGAARALYLALLEWLAESGRIPRAPARTDGEYRSLSRDLERPEPCSRLLAAHEQICFNETGLDERAYRALEQDYRELTGR